jgi:hypothetical protein
MKYELYFRNLKRQLVTKVVHTESLIQAEQIGEQIEKMTSGKMRFKNAKIAAVKSK